MVGYAGELVKWNGISWESSPAIGSGITDSRGVLQSLSLKNTREPIIINFIFRLLIQSWSNIVTVQGNWISHCRIRCSSNIRISSPCCYIY